MSTSTTRPLTGIFRDKGGGTHHLGHKDFANGVVADARTVVDGAITSGAAILTSATAAFTSADVAKRVVVMGAGTPTAGSGTLAAAAGVATFSTTQLGLLGEGAIVIVAGTPYTISSYNGSTAAVLSGTPTFGASAFTIVVPLSTTIAGYTNGTTVTLAANAGRTVSGASVLWGTDNAAAFNAGHAYLPVKGSEMLWPDGAYLIHSNLEINPDSTAFDGGRIRLKFSPGAKLYATPAVTQAIAFNHSVSQEAWVGAEDGTIDGAFGSYALVGLGIHTQMVRPRRMTVKNCHGAGVEYFADLPAMPICSVLDELSLLFNAVGVRCFVAAAGLYIKGGRIEGSDREGIWVKDAGHVSIGDNCVCELNGFRYAPAPNLRIGGNCYAIAVVGDYFEDVPYQDHSSIIIEASTSQPRSVLLEGNIVVGYATTVAGQSNANSIGIDIAPGSGLVDGVVEQANLFVGHRTSVRNGTNSRGYKLGPDTFGDTQGGGVAWSSATTYAVRDLVTSGGNSYACILAHTNQVPPNATYWVAITIKRYDRVSTLAGKVVDVNQHASTTYDTSTQEAPILNNPTLSGTVTASGGVKYTGGTSVDGSIVKTAALGLTLRGIAGSSYDWAITGTGGTSVIEGPTGTTVAEFFASLKRKTATIAYSASMTPNADAGDLQTITATNTTAFAINAPTNPRLGQRISIRTRNIAGGALGAITPNAVFKLAGGAWPSPANGFSRTLVVDWDGTNWVEWDRSASDIPN